MSVKEALLTVADHRTRVGAQRRERTLQKLIEAALPVFAEKGVDASIIDDVIAAAGMSRGTFYNYFSSNYELLAAVSEAVSNEAVVVVHEVVKGVTDPAERLSSALRLYLDLALRYPLFARFIHRTGLNLFAPSHAAFHYMPSDVRDGVACGRLSVTSMEAAVSVVIGSMLAAIYTIDTQHPHASYPEEVVQHILVALGVASDEARRLVTHPLPELPFSPDSLLHRVNERFLKDSEKSERRGSGT